MPPFRYTIIHRNSRLTRAEQDLVIAWAEGKLPSAPVATAPTGKKK
jgi:hypothetical protein